MQTEDVKKLVDSELESWRAMWARTQIPIIQMTFDPPPTRPLGEGDVCIPAVNSTTYAPLTLP